MKTFALSAAAIVAALSPTELARIVLIHICTNGQGVVGMSSRKHPVGGGRARPSTCMKVSAWVLLTLLCRRVVIVW